MLAIAGQMTDIFWENDHGTIFFLQNWNSFLRNFFNFTGIAEQLVDINIWILNILCFFTWRIYWSLFLSSGPTQASIRNPEFTSFLTSPRTFSIEGGSLQSDIVTGQPPSSDTASLHSINIFCKSNPIYLKGLLTCLQTTPPSFV